MAWHRCDPVGSKSAVNWGGCSIPERAPPQPTRAPRGRVPHTTGRGVVVAVSQASLAAGSHCIPTGRVGDTQGTAPESRPR